MREALFSILAAHVPQARVLDLFAGTGALGIEALSRGAKEAVFVEMDRHVAGFLRRNLQPFGSQAELLGMPATVALQRLGQQRRTFDLVFLDPPYAAGLYGPTLLKLAEHDMIAPDGVVVCEHLSRTPPPTAPAGLVLRQSRAFGDVTTSLYALTEGSAS